MAQNSKVPVLPAQRVGRDQTRSPRPGRRPKLFVFPRYKLWNDTEVEQFVAETSADLIWPLWQGLKPVERADVFRYLVVYEQGGYFADAWLPGEECT